ncbi:MAG: hypothetical protein KA327_00310 [Pseudarcicella sp.]|nr:hypothetical protein [Pseudarcicella sp.]
MFNKKITLGAIALFAVINSSVAQNFMPAFTMFSHKETAELYLKNGSKVTGTIKDIDRKKGLIEEITIIANDKKTVYLPEDIDYMYLPPSSYSAMTSKSATALNLSRSKDQGMNQEFLDKGYAYFQSVKVMLKKKELTLLLQVVNPAFLGKITVYNDPFAGETASVGFGPVTLAGGIDKSYFVKVDNQVAYKLEKGDYKDYFDELFKSCPSADAIEHVWRNFQQHVYEQNTNCK